MNQSSKKGGTRQPPNGTTTTTTTTTTKKRRPRTTKPSTPLQKAITGVRTLEKYERPAPVRRVRPNYPTGFGAQKQLITTLVGGPEHFHALEVALSPGDNNLTKGLPNAGFPRTVIFNHQQEMTFTNAGATSCSLLIITLPSIDVPFIMAATAGTFPALSDIISATGSTSIPTYVEGTSTSLSNTSFTFSGTPVHMFGSLPGAEYTVLRGEIKNANTTFPSFAYPTYTSSIENTNTGAAAYPNEVQSLTAIASTWPNGLQNWRLAGQGMTITNTTAALNKAGSVACRPLNRGIGHHTTSCRHVMYKDDATAFTARGWYLGASDNYELDGFPTTIAALSQTAGCYNGAAADGAYIHSRFVGTDGTWVKTDSDTAMLAVSTTDLMGPTAREIAYPARINTTLKLDQGRSATTASIMSELALSMDSNWTPTVTVFEGLPAGSTFLIKHRFSCEATSTTGGPYVSLQIDAASANVNYFPLLKALMLEMPLGAPASANWEWSDVAAWLSKAFEVAKIVVPTAMAILAIL